MIGQNVESVRDIMVPLMRCIVERRLRTPPVEIINSRKYSEISSLAFVKAYGAHLNDAMFFSLTDHIGVSSEKDDQYGIALGFVSVKSPQIRFLPGDVVAEIFNEQCDPEFFRRVNRAEIKFSNMREQDDSVEE